YRCTRGDWHSAGTRVAFQALQFSPHLSRTLIAQIAIFFEGSANDFVQLGQQTGIEFEGRNWIAVQNAIEDNGCGRTIERDLSRPMVVSYGAKENKMLAPIRSLAPRLRGGQKSSCPTRHSWRCQVLRNRARSCSGVSRLLRNPARSHKLGQAKVENLSLPASRD